MFYSYHYHNLFFLIHFSIIPASPVMQRATTFTLLFIWWFFCFRGTEDLIMLLRMDIELIQLHVYLQYFYMGSYHPITQHIFYDAS